MLEFLVYPMILLTGAWFSRSLIVDFKNKQYFSCGMDFMITIWMVLILIRVAFGL